jgi:uncharacterized protein YyaL (SSP411 family)
MLVAAENMLDQNYELVLMGPTQESVEATLIELRKHFLPNVTLICRTDDNAESRSSAIDDVLAGKKPLNDQVTIYVCQNHTCNKPVSGETEVLAAIKDVVNRVDFIEISKSGK